jgi:O-methyltransferase
VVKIVLSDGTKLNYRDIIGDDPDDLYFIENIKKLVPYTMTVNRGIESSYSLYKAVEYIIKNNIPGDFVECGVWRGGSVMLIALALAHFGDTKRKIFLYDTFTGMTKPDEKDVDWDGLNLQKKWEEDSAQTKSNSTMMWGYGGSIEEVRKNVYSSNYPKDNFIFIKGPVENTIPDTVPEKIALLRLDTDWYASTYHELVHLYPILSVGGILIIDDYGWCRGSRQATDKYIKENKLNLFLSRIDESVRLAIKR